MTIVSSFFFYSFFTNFSSEHARIDTNRSFQTGLCHVLEIILFRVTYIESDSWGVNLPNGSWTGVVGMLVRQEADLAATGLMMTSDRLDVIAFTSPVYATKYFF